MKLSEHAPKEVSEHRFGLTRRELLAASALGLVAGVPAMARAAAPAGELTWGIHVSLSPTWFDPAETQGIVTPFMVLYALQDALVKPMPEKALAPSLAESWKASPDGLHYDFVLRQGVKFHNGDPLTSADVKFSIERTYDPEAKTAVATIFTTIDKIETPDPQTVTFNTKLPDPLLPARLAFYGGQIIPEKHFKSVGADAFLAKPVGSGVIKFKEWIKDDHLTVEANKEYWGGAPDFDTAIFKPIPEPGARVASLLAGESDLITLVPADQVDRINNSGKTRVEGSFNAGLYVLMSNVKVPPLDNPKFRQALALATDRATLVKTIWRGRAIVPNGSVPKGDEVGYDPNRPELPFNLDRAKALLQEVGYKNEPVYIESTSGVLENDRFMAEAIVEMWRKAGINVQLEIIEFSVRSAKLRDRNFKGLFWFAPTSTLQDPDGLMWRVLSPGGLVDFGWRDPEFDKLGAEARTSMDKALRDKNYRRMNDIITEQAPWIVVTQAIESYGVANFIAWRGAPNSEMHLRKEYFKFNR
jgi:peptide/nickel transport system substrate-binding protein